VQEAAGIIWSTQAGFLSLHPRNGLATRGSHSQEKN